MVNKKKAQVKDDQNIFLHFNMDEIVKLAKENKCPKDGERCERIRPIPHGEKIYLYCEHTGHLHYIAPLMRYDYVINNIRAMLYLLHSGLFEKEQIILLIYDVLELIKTESTDEEFKKIIRHSLEQLLEAIKE